MTTGPRSQCDACVHLDPRQGFTQPTCDAFPSGIPDEVYNNTLDHRQPVDGDRGIRFDAKPGDEFPAYAFRRR